MRLLVPLLLAFASIAGCTDSPTEVIVSHVHDVAMTEDGATLLATHDGLVKATREEGRTMLQQWSEVRHDFMGFAQDGANASTFYASGHPKNAREYGGGNLGVLRSTDGAQTWTVEAFQGQVDFHAMVGVPGRANWVAGFGSGALLASTDGGKTWTQEQQPGGRILSLSSVGTELVAATTDGLVRSNAVQGITEWNSVMALGEGLVSSVAVSPDGQTWFASRSDGRTSGNFVSHDGGATFDSLEAPFASELLPPVFAFHPSMAGHVVAATPAGDIWESIDHGISWTQW